MKKIKIFLAFVVVFVFIISAFFALILFISHREGVRNSKNIYYISKDMNKKQVDSVMQTKPQSIIYVDSFEIYFYDSPFLSSEEVSIYFNLKGRVVKTDFE